jgi:integrase
MTTWTTAAPGIRYREHPTRKRGVRRDRYFVIRHTPAGKQVDEALGWASEGWTLSLAQEKLSELRKAKRTGQGAVTMREERETNLRTKREKAEAAAELARQQRTVAELWDRYAKEVVAVENKPRTTAEKTRVWTRRIEPKIGRLKVNDVTDKDAGELVRAPLRLDATGQVIGGKGEAANLYRLLHHMFRKALGWGLRAKEFGNPLENVSEPKVERRERLLTQSEIAALMGALEDVRECPQIVAAIGAAILTGARIGELLSLRWNDLRRDEMELHLADTKTGFSRRPISAEALAVFDSVERMVGCQYVFRGINTPTRPLRYNTVEKAFGRIAKRAGVEAATLHTIRHWFATKTANSVSNPRVGMLLTGHKSLQAYMGYIHADKDQARELADAIGQDINQLAKAGPNVVPIKPPEKAS